MFDPFLALTPLCVAGVLALVRFTGCDKLLGLDEITPPPPPMVDYTIDPDHPPTARTDFTGWVGMMIHPQRDVQITHLGRWRVGMSMLSHQMKLVDAATGIDITSGAVTVSLGGGSDESFVFAMLNDPVKLSGGSYYYLLSQETANTDAFYDFGLTVTPTADFIVVMAVYSTADAGPYTRDGTVGNCYGPVNAQYVTL